MFFENVDKHKLYLDLGDRHAFNKWSFYSRMDFFQKPFNLRPFATGRVQGNAQKRRRAPVPKGYCSFFKIRLLLLPVKFIKSCSLCLIIQNETCWTDSLLLPAPTVPPARLVRNIKDGFAGQNSLPNYRGKFLLILWKGFSPASNSTLKYVSAPGSAICLVAEGSGIPTSTICCSRALGNEGISNVSSGALAGWHKNDPLLGVMSLTLLLPN